MYNAAFMVIFYAGGFFAHTCISFGMRKILRDDFEFVNVFLSIQNKTDVFKCDDINLYEQILPLIQLSEIVCFLAH